MRRESAAATRTFPPGYRSSSTIPIARSRANCGVPAVLPRTRRRFPSSCGRISSARASSARPSRTTSPPRWRRRSNSPKTRRRIICPADAAPSPRIESVCRAHWRPMGRVTRRDMAAGRIRLRNTALRAYCALLDDARQDLAELLDLVGLVQQRPVLELGRDHALAVAGGEDERLAAAGEGPRPALARLPLQVHVEQRHVDIPPLGEPRRLLDRGRVRGDAVAELGDHG